MRFYHLFHFLFINSVIVRAFPPAAFLKVSQTCAKIRVSKAATKYPGLQLLMVPDPDHHVDPCSFSNNKEMSLWFRAEQIKILSSIMKISVDDLISNHIDVSYESQNQDDMQSSSIFRIRPNSKFHEILTSNSSKIEPISSFNDISNIEKASTLTYRWCSNFVKYLNLCPWAKQSLSSKNAIRIKVVNQSNGLEMVESAVVGSALELKDYSDRGLVDPLIAITFVVFLPNSGNSGEDEKDFDFLSFYEFFNELEEKFLNELVDINGDYIGDEVTVAPFHPNWSFAPSIENLDENGQIIDDPINYEKRTPFPTISIVMSKGIDLAGEAITAKIGLHNEKVLNEIGSTSLQNLYNEKVLNDG